MSKYVQLRPNQRDLTILWSYGNLRISTTAQRGIITVSDEKLMETDDVAHYLNVHRKTVINLVERGELRGYRVGRNWRFRKSDVDEYLERQREPKPDYRRDNG